MKYFVALILLCSLSLVSAEIAITRTDSTLSEPVFSVSGDQGILITPRIDLGTTHVFINEQLTKSFSEMNAGESYTIPAELGTQQVMIRSQTSDTFAWENYDVKSENDPMYLAYVNYDKDKNRITFAVKGVKFVHLNQLKTTVPSVNEKLTTYSAKYNGQYDLNCYPTVSTARPLTFSCAVNSWPQTLDVEVTVGMVEEYEVEVVTLAQNEVMPVDEEPEPAPPQQVEETVEQTQNTDENNVEENIVVANNISVVNNISMTDTIPEQPSTLPSTIIIIFGLLFMVVLVILYVDSHHKHEAKKKGMKITNQKQATNKNSQEESQPRYAEVGESRKKKS